MKNIDLKLIALLILLGGFSKIIYAGSLQEGINDCKDIDACGATVNIWCANGASFGYAIKPHYMPQQLFC